MVQKILAVLTMAMVLSVSANTQTTQLTLRLGPAMIVEDAHFGFAGAFDFKPGKAPLAFSPFFENASSEGLTRTYYGLNLLVTNRLDKSGLHVGAGIGSAHWSIEGSSRNALIYDFLLGFKVMASRKIGIYGHGQFNLNSKTNEDTDQFNNSSAGGFRDPVPDFLFDNDLVASVGICLILQ